MKTRDHVEGETSFVKPLLGIIVPAVCILAVFLFVFQKWMTAFHAQVETAWRQNLLQQVTLARNAIEPIVRDVRSGILSVEEGRTQARRLVRAMTYEDQFGKNYIFMSGYDGTMLVQPFEPEKEMSNQWNLQDAHGVHIIQELVKAAMREPSGGYVEYHYHLPGVHGTQQKLAFVLGIPELECYVGTGMYMQRALREQKAILGKAKYGAVGLVLAVLVLTCLAVVIILQRNRQLSSEVRWRKRVERALRESEEEYRSLVQNVNSIILRMDCHGNAIFANDFALKFFDFTEDEILGKSVIGTIVPETESTGRDLTAMIVDIGRNPDLYVQNENENMRRGGERVWVAWTNRALRDGNGNVKEVLCVGNDITERRRIQEERLEMERRLLHTQKLESLGVLAGGIAHDFNNLLAAILANLELALLELPPQSSTRACIEKAGNAARRAADLTRQMLAYSGRGQFSIQELDLTKLVEENVSMLKSAMSRTTTFELRLQPGLPLMQGDPGQVQQVIMNLITNASESLDGRPGAVTLSTGEGMCDEVCLSLSRIDAKPAPGRFVWLEVGDTGCGMPAEVLERLFEPFFTTKFTGRGLGMAAVQGIVRGHGGALLVHSEVLKGTTIRVLFPVSQAIQAGKTAAGDEVPAPMIPERRDFVSAQILVADDEEMVREICGAILEQLGFRVLLAADGHEALEVFRSHAGEIDCVILDLMMPELDGVATFKELEKIDPKVRVILCSGYSAQEATRYFSGLEVAGFIGKPYSVQTLREEVERVLGDAHSAVRD